MANSPVDRNVNYMKKMWGTNKLVTDYGSENSLTEKTEFIQEIMEYGEDVEKDVKKIDLCE
jgi:hypothetical protein